MRAITARMDLATAAYVMKILAAVMAAAWTLLVLYDVAVAESGTRKIITHAIYAVLSLGAVVILVMNPPD